MDTICSQNILFNLNELIKNIKMLENKNTELESFKNKAEEMCESVPVVENMTLRIEKLENNLFFLLKERETFIMIDNLDISCLIQNKILLDWYIQYKLGVQLKYDYDLIEPFIDFENDNLIKPIKNITYKSHSDKIIGYQGLDSFNEEFTRLEHLRFIFHVEIPTDITHNLSIINLFNKFYKNKLVIIRSYKGGIYYKIIESCSIYEGGKINYIKKNMEFDAEHWYVNSGVDVSGYGTREIIINIIENIHTN